MVQTLHWAWSAPSFVTQNKRSPNHSIQWQEVSYLENEEDWKKRKIKEALYINAMDSKEIMNLEKGFEINPCWNEFSPHIRNIAQKKGKL